MICPRCNKQRFGVICGNCDLRYRPDYKYAQWCLPLNCGDVIWFDNGVEYWPTQYERILLPRLPFTITEEDLQKYLILLE